MKEPQMPTITFVNRDGTREEVAATHGDSAMQAATTQGVHGTVAGCGGNAKCATCHVYVDESWLGMLTRAG
jgi:ferredoxin, 2Fe-2S